MSEYSNQVRRKDRQETTEEFLNTVLHDSASCTIAIEKDGFPLIHVAFYEYDESNREIIFHFSRHGHAGEQITDGKKVGVSVYKYGKLYTAPKAVDFGCEYQSVIIYGTISIVEDENERLKAMDLFFNKFFQQVPKDSYKGFTSLEAKPIHVAKIKIIEWLGKEHRVPENALSSFYHLPGPVL